MGRIFVSGDTHGSLDFEKLERLADAEKLTYEDYIIICGDAGIVWSKDTLDDSISSYEELNTNILFIDGNHENFDMLNNYKIEKWNGGDVHRISKNIYHLARGQVFELLGKSFFTMGGAESTDKDSRTEHFTLWKDESITNYDLIEATISLSQYNNKVDYIISHTMPTSAINEFVDILTQCGESIPYFLEKKLLQSQSNEMLEKLYKKIKFEHWYCGHFHTDQELKKLTILYSNIIKIV